MSNTRLRSLIMILTVAVSVPSLLAKSGEKKWVGTWASSPLLDGKAKNAEELLAVGAQSGATLREVIHVSMGGDIIRVRFSNLYGTSPLAIGAVEIAQTLKGVAIVPGTNKVVTFNGQPSVSIPPGALVVSDPTPFKLAALSDLTVSFFLPNPSGPVTEHQLGNATSYHVTGNVVSSASLESPTTATSWYYLNGVDTLA
ncbi:MAG: hypothetical protein QOH35_1109, partial [Acidobacteriaceae bacterium]|nr:hypothetical protein [Acidobacteriaceae bacterium]